MPPLPIPGFQPTALDDPLPLQDYAQDDLPSSDGKVYYYHGVQATLDSYSEYEIEKDYEIFEGISASPVAGSSGSQRLLRLNAPYGQLSIQWTAHRRGFPPVLPHWDTGNANEVLVYRRIKPLSPKIIPGGEMFLFRVWGYYRYNLLFAHRQHDNFDLPVTMIDTLKPADCVLGEWQFSASLTESAEKPASFVENTYANTLRAEMAYDRSTGEGAVSRPPPPVFLGH